MESAEDRLWCDGAEAMNGSSKRRREIIVPTFEAPEGLAIFVLRLLGKLIADRPWPALA